MVLSDLVINSPKSSNDELNPVRKEIYLGGNTLSSCGWAEWELGRNWQGSCLVLLWQNVQFCHVWERLTLQVSFFQPVLLKWVAGGPPADGLEGLNGNQMNNRAVRQSCLGARHRLGGWQFCLVISEINTVCCVCASAGNRQQSVGDGLLDCT